MTLLSRKVDYALLILSYLHSHQPGGASAHTIAAHYGLGRPFVANILKVLCQKGFVESHRGVKGGYVLHRPATQIHLAELMDALDDSFHLTTCSSHAPDEPRCVVETVCTVRHALAEVHERIREVLRGVTLEQIFTARSVPGQDGTTQFGLTLSGLPRPLVG
jgi:Rrf2 family protein